MYVWMYMLRGEEATSTHDRTSAHEFSYDVRMKIVLKVVDELDDIWVALHEFQDGHLAVCVGLVLADDLDRVLLAGRSLHAPANRAGAR